MNLKLAIVPFLFAGAHLVFAQGTSDERKVVPVISSTKYTEFSPTISADGRTMIFESSLDMEKGWELFESQLDEQGNWSPPVPLKSINEKCNFLAGPSISYDGNLLFYTAFIEGKSQTEDIYYSTRTGDNIWSEPVNIGAPINTEDGYEGFPSISPDGKTLYFVRLNMEHDFDKKSKEPCFAIYYSKKTTDGKWGEPVLMPAPINLGCERDPKIMADNHTLIFSSIRDGGVGKYDMYQTVKQNDGTWSVPVTLDFINSAENDQSPCISAYGDKMFFYSKNDIYSIPIPEKFRQRVNAVVEGRVLDDKKLAPLPAVITVFNTTTGETFSTSNNATDGEYSVVLNAGYNYKITFDNSNFFPDTLVFALENQKKFELISKNIIMRSSYPVLIDVVDKDLKKRMNVWLNVGRAEKDIIKDSVSSSQLPMKVMFEAPYNYVISSAKDKYIKSDQVWTFKEKRLSPDKNVIVGVEHTKAPFVASVISSSTKQKVNVKVMCHNKSQEEVLIANSEEKIKLRKGDRYEVIAGSQEGYFFSSTEVVGGIDSAVVMQVIPIEVGALLTLNNITFETNSAELKKGSQFELDRIVELMKFNPTVTIEISAHTDDVGTDANNLQLSDKRAKSAFEYLKTKGVNFEKLVPKGYGESKPVVPNDSDANRAQNRRVELRILKLS
ncbi:MAG: OmpA family protein [Bacteroidetes bacterium]|nr:OmpA family protein [Bacteroidota bacterium]